MTLLPHHRDDLREDLEVSLLCSLEGIFSETLNDTLKRIKITNPEFFSIAMVHNHVTTTKELLNPL